MKKNIIITGTSTGVGFESSLLMARNGYKVYATMRNLSKGEAMQKIIIEEGLDIELLPLDVSDTASIQAAVNTILEKDGKIDILINNAGAGFAKTTEQASEEEIAWVTDVNYLGVVRCTKAVLPIMRKQKSGHIINITSIGGLVGQPFNELYCGAKFAVEGYAEALASYLTIPFNIHFSNVEPGGIATDFMKSAVEKTTVEGQIATGEYLPIFEQYISGIQQRAGESKLPLYQTPAEVAELIFKVMNMEEPPLRIRTSEWAEQLGSLKTQIDPDGLKLVKQVRDSFL